MVGRCRGTPTSSTRTTTEASPRSYEANRAEVIRNPQAGHGPPPAGDSPKGLWPNQGAWRMIRA
jgi:hypothetical protein